MNNFRRALILAAVCAALLSSQTNPTGEHGVSLTWAAGSCASSQTCGSTTGYNVKRATVSGGPYTTIASPTTPSYTDGCASPPAAGCTSTLAEGTTYYYVVTATGPGGESANSNEFAAKIPTFTPPPPAPSGLQGQAH